MAIEKVLARDWTTEIKDGGGYSKIGGLNSLTFSGGKTDAEVTDFDSDGWAEHMAAERTRSVAGEGFFLEMSRSKNYVASLTVTHAATGDGNVTVTCGSDAIVVAVLNGDTIAQVAGKIATEVDDDANWTAQAVSDVVYIMHTADGDGFTASFVDTDATGVTASITYEDRLDYVTALTVLTPVGPAAAGNVTVTLDLGDIVVALANNDTATVVATKIAAEVEGEAGWCARSTGATVTIFIPTTGADFTATYVDTDTTGATASIVQSGDRDRGQQLTETVNSEMAVDSLEDYRLTSPGGTEYTFSASVEVGDQGGGNNDPSSWSFTLTVDGEVTIT